MGDVIVLDDRRRTRLRRDAAAAARRGRPARRRVTFAFDAASPWTYLAAERVERRFAAVRWLPVAGAAAGLDRDWTGTAARAAVEHRAAELGLPLVWPERAPGPAAGRVAALAAERGRAAAFVVAAGRLAYCGGFDLDDPEVLAEAAAVAGLRAEETTEAARDPGRDAPALHAAASLARGGATALPVLQVGRTLLCAERGIAAAAALLDAGP